MIAPMIETDRYEPQFDDSLEDVRFERFAHRRGGDFPVRSHSARTKARMRGRATASGRNKARCFNGVNRRGRGKQWSVLC